MVVTRARSALAAVAVCAAVAAVVAVAPGGAGHPAHADSSTTAGDTVSVDGAGTVQGVPDRLTARFGVHATRASVHDALDAIAADARRLIGALHHAGVASRDIRSTDLELDPHYDNHGQRTGYDASEAVSATFDDVSTAGQGISDTASSAGNSATVDGLSFDLSSDTKLLARARSAAFADAKARAQQYADLTGRSLGAVRHITETVLAPDGPQPQYYKGVDGATGAASAAPVPVQPGQQPVTVVVTVVWQLT